MLSFGKDLTEYVRNPQIGQQFLCIKLKNESWIIVQHAKKEPLETWNNKTFLITYPAVRFPFHSFKIISATATTKRRKTIVFQNNNVPKFEVHIPPQKKFPNNLNRRNLHNTYTSQTQANAETNTKMGRKLIRIEQNPPFPTTVHVNKKKKKNNPSF